MPVSYRSSTRTTPAPSADRKLPKIRALPVMWSSVVGVASSLAGQAAGQPSQHERTKMVT